MPHIQVIRQPTGDTTIALHDPEIDEIDGQLVPFLELGQGEVEQLIDALRNEREYA